MTKLEDLSAGTRVKGVAATGVVTVESIQWIGEQAVKAIYEMATAS